MCRRALVLALWSLVCSCRTAPPPESTAAGVVAAAQPTWLNGWSAADADRLRQWYTLPQGSHLLLWDLFMALEQEQKADLFASRPVLEGYGFLYPDLPEPTLQEDARLPIGFRKDTSILDGHDYLGFNCAACHTGVLHFQGRRRLLHGGQGTGQLDRFLVDLGQALRANQQPAKLGRLRQRLGWAEDRVVAAQLAAAIAALDEIKHNLLPTVNLGPGRLDAVGWILNTVTATEAGIPTNWGPVTAPVSYPHLWRAPDLDCVQTNCAANDPITRNIGEVLGVFGHVHLQNDTQLPDSIDLLMNAVGLGTLFLSSPKFANIYALEESLRRLRAPHWPADFPAVDPDLATKGKAVYQSQCASCHAVIQDGDDGVPSDAKAAPDERGRSHIRVSTIDYRAVGTDPEFMNNYGHRDGDPGVLKPLVYLLDPFWSLPERYPLQKILGFSVNLAAERYFLSPEFKTLAADDYVGDDPDAAAADLRDKFHNYRVTKTTEDLSYKARPLDGVIFTGPFLHNGSVPTLWDLLQKGPQRPATFQLGRWEFDAHKLGVASAEGPFTFDTSLTGNSNRGHEYGTDLSEADKWALLEYMKIL